jgi:hypothetical protein
MIKKIISTVLAFTFAISLISVSASELQSQVKTGYLEFEVYDYSQISALASNYTSRSLPTLNLTTGSTSNVASISVSSVDMPINAQVSSVKLTG